RVALHDPLQFVARVKSHDVPGLDGDRLAGARIAARPGRLAPDVEVAEAGHFDVVAREKRRIDEVEEGLDHVLRLALVEAEALEQQLGELRLGQRRRHKRRQEDAIGRTCGTDHGVDSIGYCWRRRAPSRAPSEATTAPTMRSI